MRPYTYKELEAIAKREKTILNMSNNCNGAYQVIMKNKKFRPIRKLLKSTKAEYTYKGLKELAKKYSRRVDFQNENEAAYMYCLRRGWVDKICRHIPDRRKYLNFRDVQKEAKKYKSTTKFRKKAKIYYAAAQRHGWIDKVCNHMTRSSSKPYTFKELKAIAKKYNTVNEWRYGKDSGAYSSAKNKKLLPKLIKHMKSALIKYSNEDLRKIAKKYTRRIDFQTHDSGAYGVARLRGLLNKICKHMIRCQKLSEVREHNKIANYLRSNFPKIEIKEQYKINQCSGRSKGRIDIFINLSNGKNLGIEVKSDKRYWSPGSLKKQIDKYNRYLKQEGYMGTFICSVKGRYGLSQEEIVTFIKKIQ